MALYGLRIPPAPKHNGSETADTIAAIALIPQTGTIKRDETESEPKSEEDMRVLLLIWVHTYHSVLSGETWPQIVTQGLDHSKGCGL
jgi:hypothetical protein